MPEYDTTTTVHVIPETIIIPGAVVQNWYRIGVSMRSRTTGVAGVSVPQKMKVKTMVTGYATMLARVTE